MIVDNSLFLIKSLYIKFLYKLRNKQNTLILRIIKISFTNSIIYSFYFHITPTKLTA